MSQNNVVNNVGGLAVFGDGVDGDVTIYSNTTLSSDKYYLNLTINSGITLTTASYRIFCKSILNNIGIIRNNGNSGSGISGNGGAALAAGTLGGSNAGGNGATGNGGTGQASNPGGGGKGGNGGDGTGGNGGIANTPFGTVAHGGQSVASGGIATMLNLVGALMCRQLDGTLVNAGGGGGGGGGDGTNYGGGGGGGGGAILIVSRKIIGSGSITAKGGSGGNRSGQPGNTGGGGGGGGGFIVCITSEPSLIMPVAIKGTPGSASGSGTVGSYGVDGKVILLSEN